MLNRRHLLIFLLCFFFSVLSPHAFARYCQQPDFTDPDEWFDSIGGTNSCQESDDWTKDSVRSDPSRENMGSGFVTSDGGNSNSIEGGRTIGIGPSGSIFVVGRTNGADTSNTNDFLIIKYFADGSLDSSFDTDGKALHSFGTRDEWAHGVAVDSSGRVVVAGRTDSNETTAAATGEFRFAALRLTTNGVLDTTFNTSGKVTGSSFSSKTDIARAVKIQTDGMIVLAGYGRNTNYDFAFMRFKTDGALDTSFATSGRQTFPNGASDNAAFSVTLDSNGMIIGGGTSYQGNNWDFAAARLTTGGALDTTFRTTGKLIITSFSVTDDVAYAVDADAFSATVINRVVLAGMTLKNLDKDFAFARVFTDGTLDTSFLTSGKGARLISTTFDGANGMVDTTIGNTITAAGYAEIGGNYDFYVVRLWSTGHFDTSFHTDGKYSKAFNSNEDTAQAIYEIPPGGYYVAGRTDTNGSNNYDIALMRLQLDGTEAKSGNVVKHFATNGVAITNFSGVDFGYSIAGDIFGNLVVVGRQNVINTSFDWTVARLNKLGTVDTSFNTSGAYTIDHGSPLDVAKSVFIQTNGKYLVTGDGANTRYIQIMRFETTGALDTTFSTDGKLQNTVGSSGLAIYTAPSIDTSFNISVTGTAVSGADYAFIRMTSDGQIDTTFSTDAFHVESVGATDVPHFGMLDTNGAHIAIGWLDAAKDYTQVVKLKSDGALDTSFYTTGEINTSFTNIDYSLESARGAVLPDGKIHVGFSNEASASFYIAVNARFLVSGGLDTSFNTDGINTSFGKADAVPFSVYGMTVQANDKTIALTNDSTIAAVYNYQLIRYTTGGNLDTTFNSSGEIRVTVTANTEYPRANTVTPYGIICAVGQANVSSGITGDFGTLCVWP